MPVNLVSPKPEHGATLVKNLPVESLREHLVRALLSMHLAARETPPSERLPPAQWTRPSSRLSGKTITLNTLSEFMARSATSDAGVLYGNLLIYAVNLWRAWSRTHLPCSPGFTLLAPPALFAPQNIECPDGPRTFRVRLAPAGCRPLRERWESAPLKAYREPIPHSELLDGLTFIVENELQPLRWIHLPPWTEAGAVRPLSARAATERRAPRLWLFPLEHGKLQFELIPPKEGRSWTGGFVMNLTRPMTLDHRSSLNAELKKIARLVAEKQEPGPSRDVLVFPELCLDLEGVRYLLAVLEETGARPALVIAGSHHAWGGAPGGAVHALAPVYSAGEDNPLWCHHKRGPFRVTGEDWKAQMNGKPAELRDDAELWEHINPGGTFTTFDGPGGRVGVLICADLLEERFPAMRDLVRIALVDLLVVVNYSFKTTLFMRHAEQLNRLGVCAVFLNAAGAFRQPYSALAQTEGQPIDPFSALVALPQLAVPGAARRPTWLTWRHTDRRVEERVGSDWREVHAEGEVAQFHHPAALLVDLNAWLVDPVAPATYGDAVMTRLDNAIQAALTDNTRPREDRIAALRANEKNLLPTIGASLTDKARTLLLELHRGGLFGPTRAENEDTLKSLIEMRLARPHRLAIPPTKVESKEAQTNDANAESHFIVSLTPLGSALVEHLLQRTTRSTRLGA